MSLSDHSWVLVAATPRQASARTIGALNGATGVEGRFV
ncbi:hypothetical protein TGCAST_317830, partial [Toxoplasma gondii CAST]